VKQPAAPTSAASGDRDAPQPPVRDQAKRTPPKATNWVDFGAAEQLSDIDAANVVRCARVLLRRPLLRTGGPDGDLLPLVYRHRTALTDLFATLLGYQLVVQRQFARLYKAGPGHDSSRGESTLSPRGYAYLALSLAALTGGGRQVLLSRLVADIRAAGTRAGIAVRDDIADRRALTAALRHLVTLGVITETDGTVSAIAGEPTEALITIDTDLLGALVVGPLSEATGPEELITLAARPGPRGDEHTVRRLLVENPVVLYRDLQASQVDWLRRRLRRESALLERCFGLVTEARAEGVAITDPEDYLTDVVFPSTSTVARMALLALPDLLVSDAVDVALDEGPTDGRADLIPTTVDRVRACCARLVEEYPAAWSRAAVEDLDALANDVLALLVSLGLARRDPAGPGWLLSPAAHRWAPEPDDTPASPVPGTPPAPVPAGWSLFEESS